MTEQQDTKKASLSYRLRFEKKGPIRLISHLDLTRAFHRAFIRASLPLKFSEGFSPHPKFSFALPLSVGTESETELADFSLQGDSLPPSEEILSRLQAQMPDGIRLLSIGPRVLLPEAKSSQIFAAEKCLAGPLTVQKKNKKGKWVEKDLSPGIHSLKFVPSEEGGVVLEAYLSVSAELYTKPEAILGILSERLPEFSVKGKRILRTGIFRSDLVAF